MGRDRRGMGRAGERVWECITGTISQHPMGWEAEWSRGHSLVFLSLHLSFPGYEMRINICLQEAAVVRINWLVLQEPFEDERPSLQMLSKLRTCLALMSQVKPERTAGD